ncbi:MAG: hypothetical protein AABX02_03745 [archaeon]
MNREQQVEEFLDESEKNYLITRYAFSPDFATITEFAVMYLTWENDRWVEIVKIDGDPTEAVHIHFSYSTKLKKMWNKPVSWNTLFEAVNRIKANWRMYLLAHNESKGL